MQGQSGSRTGTKHGQKSTSLHFHPPKTALSPCLPLWSKGPNHYLVEWLITLGFPRISGSGRQRHGEIEQHFILPVARNDPETDRSGFCLTQRQRQLGQSR